MVLYVSAEKQNSNSSVATQVEHDMHSRKLDQVGVDRAAGIVGEGEEAERKTVARGEPILASRPSRPPIRSDRSSRA